MTKEILMNTGEVILIDDEDFPVISRFSWRKISQKGYAGGKVPYVAENLEAALALIKELATDESLPF